MPTTCREFHLFPQLPLEIREEIWRWCLPHRVCEMDFSLDEIIFSRDDFYTPAICQLDDTTQRNGRAPSIWSVCRESRAVALETGKLEYVLGRRPEVAVWYSGMQRSHYWEDHARDSAHLNWTRLYTIEDVGSSGNPIHAVAWEALNLSGTGSIMLYLLEGSPYIWPGEPVVPPGEGPDLTKPWYATEWYHEESHAPQRFRRRRDLQALRQLPKWLVVMRVVIVHCDIRTGAESGLFGLLGDARVQVVDVAAANKTKAFLDLASSCEGRTHVAVQQDFQMPDVEAMSEQLDEIVRELGYEDISTAFRPAIMFRLCTQMCNRFDRVQPPFGCALPPAGRGMGRGRGVA